MPRWTGLENRLPCRTCDRPSIALQDVTASSTYLNYFIGTLIILSPPLSPPLLESASLKPALSPLFPSGPSHSVRSTAHTRMPDTVVLGAGIIGLSTAYYLAKLSKDSGVEHAIHIVEPCPQLFSSASGKAGGFLAKDWFNPTMAPLGELSFRLHQELAEQHNGRAKWGYSPSISYSLDRNASLRGDSDTDSSNQDFDSSPPISPRSEGHPLEDGPAPQATAESNGYTAGRANETEDPPPHRRNKSNVGEDWMETGESRMVAVEQRLADATAASTAPAAEAEAARHVGAGAEEQAAAALSQANADEAFAALVNESTAAVDIAKLDEPFWLRTDLHAVQAISDKTTTAQW